MVEGARVISVLRHGRVDGPPHVFRGRTDTSLSAAGWSQMQASLDGLGNVPFLSVATSPLQRCAGFARAFADRQRLPLHVDEGFRERDFGDWDGLDAAQAAARDPLEYGRFRDSGRTLAPPGGEGLDGLLQRVVATWAGWRAGLPTGHHLLVTHAGVMRVLLMHLIGLPATHAYRMALPEAALFQVSCLDGETPVLLTLNPASTGN